MKIPIKGQKTIGTLVPLSALRSAKLDEADQGTFAVCLPFFDWLIATGQSAWELLPLNETHLEPGSSIKHVLSPYNSYGIGLDPKYIPKSFTRIPTLSEKEEFIDQNKDWISDYAFFCALRDQFKTDDWRLWPQVLKHRDKIALNSWGEKLQKEIDHYITLQWQASESYREVKNHARDLGILLVGDLPFYISVRSPLVWAHREVFQMDQNGGMKYVSGVPLVDGVHFGRQVWGHPLYDWDSQLNRKNILWFWKMRLTYQYTLYDLIRIDHSLGFFSYGMMDSQNLANDKFKAGPGSIVFEELTGHAAKLGLSVFVEDSGEDLKDFEKSLHKYNVQGIKVFRFAFNEKEDTFDNKHADISSYPKNCIAYSTTHDTETLMGYLDNMTSEQKVRLAEVIKVEYSPVTIEFAKRIRGAILNSQAGMVILPIQDWLLTKDRINIPGTEQPKDDQNWKYVLTTPIESLPSFR